MEENLSSKPILDFDEVQDLFKGLGIRTFGADLPDGRIYWMDAVDRVVARGRCEAALSWAPDDTVMWAHAIPDFVKAGVPVLRPGDDIPPRLVGFNLMAARQLAMKVASRAGAWFLYDAPTGNGAVLILAVYDFEAGGLEADAKSTRHREAVAHAYTLGALDALVTSLEDPHSAADPEVAMQRLARALREQAAFVLKGSPAAHGSLDLARRLDAWLPYIAEHRAQIAIEVRQALEAWQAGSPEQA